MIQWKKIILSTIAAIGIACFAGGTADAASVKIDEKTFPDVCVRTAVAHSMTKIKMEFCPIRKETR